MLKYMPRFHVRVLLHGLNDHEKSQNCDRKSLAIKALNSVSQLRAQITLPFWCQSRLFGALYPHQLYILSESQTATVLAFQLVVVSNLLLVFCRGSDIVLGIACDRGLAS